MAGPCDKEAAEQWVRVVRGITLARKVLIIRETEQWVVFPRSVRPLCRPRYRGFAATAARATSNEVSRACASL